MEYLFLWLICIGIGTAIGQSKGKTGTGFLLSFLLGVIGVIIVACLSTDYVELERRKRY